MIVKSITKKCAPNSKHNLLFFAFITGFMLFTTSISAMPLTCQINFQQSPEGGKKELDALVEFSLTNESSNSISVLLWNSPWEGWKNRFLKVSVNDEALEYQGAMMKRGEPQASDFISLKAKETLSNTLNLAEAYPLQKGHYNIRYHGFIYTLTAPDQQTDSNTEPMELQKLDCPALEFDLK